ncbi:MAG: hypothetical protein PVJ33_07025 [Lysobacterales bacterium]|jgi:hypothetical protein
MKIGSLLAAVLLSIVAVAHLLRLLFAVDIVVGGYVIPQWVSVGGVVLPGLIAMMLWKESR